MPSPEIYLDNCATTRAGPEVGEAMAPCLGVSYGNAGSAHRLGREAARLVEEARAVVARCIGAAAEEVYFTSGGTEANNLALKGAAWAAGPGAHLVASAVEHSSVLDTLKALAGQGYRASLVAVDGAGLVEAEAFLSACGPGTACASLMYVNNEVGAVEPVAEVGRLLREARPGVLYHIDAVQALGKLPIDVAALGCDLLTLSAHKAHGPKGVGALYVRSGTRLQPLLHGGLKERGLRPGTHNVPGIVGFRAALEATDPQEASRLAGLRDRLAARLLEIPKARLNGPLGSAPERAAPHVLNISLPGAAAEMLVKVLSERGVYISSRAASCDRDPDSHVLAAMGLAPELRRSAVRVCLSRFNTAEEIEAAAEAIDGAVFELRLPAGPS